MILLWCSERELRDKRMDQIRIYDIGAIAWNELRQPSTRLS